MLMATLAMLTAAGVILYRGARSLERGARELTVSAEGDAALLRWDGEVRAPMARLIGRAALASPSATIIVELNSPGGSIPEGRLVIDALDRIAASRQLVTRMRAGEFCLSMCVPIYLRGERRVAGASAMFMFHEPQPVNVVTGERVDTAPFDQERSSRRFVSRYLENSPIDREWLGRMRPRWRDGEVWRDARALLAEGANIVEEIE